MHSLEARPKAQIEYTEKENAPLSGASPLTCRSILKCLVVFLGNDLLALMLNCLCHSALASDTTERVSAIACDSGGTLPRL